MPGQPCDFNAALGNSANRSLVSIEGDQILPVEYCLSKVVEEHCRLQFSLIIMLLVIGCNFMKVMHDYGAVARKSPTLVTSGDAIESFLAERDPTTKSSCTLGKDKFSVLSKELLIGSRLDRKARIWEAIGTVAHL